MFVIISVFRQIYAGNMSFLKLTLGEAGSVVGDCGLCGYSIGIVFIITIIEGTTSFVVTALVFIVVQ